jgi:hypothetical protein
VIFYNCSGVYGENIEGIAAGDEKVGDEMLIM